MKPSKSQLLEEIARGRAAVIRDFSRLAEEVNIPRKAGMAFRSRPGVWLACAAAFGWFLAGPKRRTVRVAAEKSRKKAGAGRKPGFGLLGLLKLALPVLKPALTAYAAKRFADIAERMAK